MSDALIRPAVPGDVGDILRLIRLLATYERDPDAVVATQDGLLDVLFPLGGGNVGCDVAEVDGRVVAICLWFLNFSTWTGRPGIYLEDLFVEPEYRRLGLGRKFLQLLAARCIERDYRRLEWAVLDWNTPAIDFYATLGALPMHEWTVHRVSGEALVALAQRSPARLQADQPG